MVTSTISLAPNYFFYFVIGSLICVYSSNILADDVSTYKMVSEKYFKFRSTLSTFVFEGIIDTRPSKFQNNTVIVKIKNLNVIFKMNDDPELNVYECKSFEGLEEAFLKPFAIVYDTNGILQKIRVSEGEPHIVSNLKLILSSMLQINTYKLVEQKEPHFMELSNEPVVYGSCDVKYDIKNPEGDSYVIVKDFNVSTCSLINNTFDDSYLTEVCNSAEDKNQKFQVMQDMNLILTDSVSYNRSYTVAQFSYKPFKQCANSRLTGAILTLVELLPKVEVDTISEDNLNVEVSALTYTKVNQNIFQNKDSTNQRKLEDLYQALACNSYNMNPYMDLIEQVIMC